MTVFTHLKKHKGLYIGFSSLGGAIGMIIGLIIFLLIIRCYFMEYISTYLVGLGLLYGIAKLGCHFAGCCHGIPYSGPFAICYRGFERVNSDPRFPVQLAESLLFIIAFLIINIVGKEHSDRQIMLSSIAYPIVKFSMDFLREKNRNFLSTNQIICLILCFLGISLYYFRRQISAKIDRKSTLG